MRTVNCESGIDIFAREITPYTVLLILVEGKHDLFSIFVFVSKVEEGFFHLNSESEKSKLVMVALFDQESVRDIHA